MIVCVLLFVKQHVNVMTNKGACLLLPLLSRERQANERYSPRGHGEPGPDHRAEKRVPNGP